MWILTRSRRPRSEENVRGVLAGRVFWLLFIASAAENAAYSGSSPVLPLFLENRFSSSGWMVGAVAAAAPLVSLAAQPLAGMASDRFGFARSGMCGAAVAALGVVVTMASWIVPGAALGRALLGAGGAVVTTAATAWVVSLAPRPQRGYVLGIFGLAVWTGLALGPLICQNLYTFYGANAMWWATFALFATALLAILAASLSSSTPDTDPVENETPRRDGRHGRRFVIGMVWKPGLAAAIAWSAEAATMTYAIVHLTSRGLPSTGWNSPASIFPVFAVSVVVTRLLLGRAMNRVPARRIAVTSHCLLAGACVVMAMADTFAGAAIAAVILGAGFSPLYPALMLLVTDAVPTARRGAGVGAFNACAALGVAVGQFGGGVIYGQLGGGAMFLAAAGVQPLALLMLVFAKHSDGSQGNDDSL